MSEVKERAAERREALQGLAAQFAQLRHLYAQMVNGQIYDLAAAADGLLAPAIRAYERALQKEND